MNNVKGAFILRNEGNGCLTSVYLEHRTNTPYTECCKQITTDNRNDPFEGNFNTCWIEEGRIEPRRANLSIKRQGDVYNLHWAGIPDSKWEYNGTAMMFENKLVGCYWKR